MSRTALLFAVILCGSWLRGASADPPLLESSQSESDWERGGFENDSNIRKELTQDQLQIGGYIEQRFQEYLFDPSGEKASYFLAPQTTSLYFDSQLKNDKRVYFRGRMIHDPTINEQVPSPLSLNYEKKTIGIIDEMKLAFNANAQVFFTIGVQKIKWGAARFWNPTDFVNSTRRDFLQTEDLRPGVALLKVNVPFGSDNFYFISSYDDVQAREDMGYGLRYEHAGTSCEISLSAYDKSGYGKKFGADLSGAVGSLDLYIEAAYTNSVTNDPHWDGSFGWNYEQKYSDEDTWSVGMEAYHSDTGYGSRTTSPFYYSKDYLLLSLLLPQPFSWNDTTFAYYHILNQATGTSYGRLLMTQELLQDIQMELAYGTSYGLNQDDVSGSLRIQF